MLTDTQFEILIQLLDDKPKTVNDLIRGSLRRDASVRTSLVRMERHGLVKRDGQVFQPKGRHPQLWVIEPLGLGALKDDLIDAEDRVTRLRLVL